MRNKLVTYRVVLFRTGTRRVSQRSNVSSPTVFPSCSLTDVLLFLRETVVDISHSEKGSPMREGRRTSLGPELQSTTLLLVPGALGPKNLFSGEGKTRLPVGLTICVDGGSPRRPFDEEWTDVPVRGVSMGRNPTFHSPLPPLPETTSEPRR